MSLFSLHRLRGPWARLSLLFALILAASVVRAEAPPPVIRIGIASPPMGSPPIYTLAGIGLAINKGWLDEEFKADGTKVQIVYFKGAGPAVNEALTNKQLDFAFQGDLPSVIGRAGGLKTRILMSTAKFMNIYLVVPADSTIQSVKDLRGKRVAIFKGTNAQLPIDRLLEANGLTERDLRAINLDRDSALAAITTKDIDAAFGFTELLTLRDQGKARLVYTSGNGSAVYTRQAHVLVTEDFVQKFPQTTERVVKALVKTARWGSDPANRDEVYRLWSLMGVPVSQWIEETGKRTLADQLNPLLDPFMVARYQDTVEQAYRLKLTRSKFEVEPWFDRRFLDAALKSLKLEGYWKPYDAAGNAIATTTAAAK